MSLFRCLVMTLSRYLVISLPRYHVITLFRYHANLPFHQTPMIFRMKGASKAVSTPLRINPKEA